MKLKALSVKQPWANMIASGEKTIETRTWSTNYRGELLILSSKQPPIKPAGCAVALVTLIDIRVMLKADEGAAWCELYPNALAWVLDDIRPLEPIPMKGALGVFDVEVDEADMRIRAKHRRW